MGQEDSPPTRSSRLRGGSLGSPQSETRGPPQPWSNKAPWYVIDPRTSKYIGKWDVFTSLALVFVAFVTPFEVALLEPTLDPLFIMNRIVDTIFLIDMCFSFVTVYSVRDTYITSPRKIVCHYLQTWFLLDFLSVGISGIDVYVVVDQGNEVTDVDALNNLRTLRIVRVLRFFRVLKLLRIMRAARIFARWESKLAIDYNSLQLIKSVTAAFVVSHWIACLWITQAFMQGDDAPMKSWLTDSFEYCRPYENAKGYTCEPPEQLYFASLYHTVLCLFGGLEATPGNGAEMLVATLLMLLSGLVWSHVMATVVGIVSMSDPDEADFRATMDSLNGYMSREMMPSELRMRAREYFQKSKHVRRTDTRTALLDLMPYSLQAEFVLFTSRVWMERVWFLNGLDGEEDYPFLVDFAKQVTAKVFAPGDWAPSGFLYIIHRGIALYKVQVLTRGKVFGDDFLLASDSIRDQSAARAMNYLEVYVCNREDVLCLAEKYPETWRKVRKRVLFRTMRKAIVGKKEELLGILENFRVMVDKGLINEADDPMAKQAKITKDVAVTPAMPSRPLVEQQGTPGPLQRARHARNKNRAERRAAGTNGVLSGMGAMAGGLMRSSPSSSGLGIRSPSRAQINVTSSSAPEDVHVQGTNGQQHSKSYQPEQDPDL